MEYLAQNSGKDVSLLEIANLGGMVPRELHEAAVELEKEGEINVVLDKEGRKWLRHKEQ